MIIPLIDAPFDEALELVKVENQTMLSRFHHMGLYEGSLFTRLDEEVLAQSVRVKGPGGEVVLCGKMCARIVVHLDDGRKLPLIELKPGEEGHIEGLTGRTEFGRSMEILGLNDNAGVELMRRIPPMEYLTLVDGERNVRISEGVAAKIWGRIGDRHLQFCSASKGKAFVVERILEEEKSYRAHFFLSTVRPGSVLTLEGVKPAETFNMSKNIKPVVIYSHDGLRLMLPRRECAHIFVRVESRLR